MKLKFLILGFLVFGLSLASQAQTATPKVVKKQIKQQKRIHKGVKSGALTKKETIKLQKQQKHINRTKRKAKSDGVVTKKERAKIHRKQTRASKNIYKQKHDKQRRNN